MTNLLVSGKVEKHESRPTLHEDSACLRRVSVAVCHLKKYELSIANLIIVQLQFHLV